MKRLPRESYVGLGLIIGVTVGALTDNVGLWLAVGLAIGAGLYATAGKPKSDSDSASESEDE